MSERHFITIISNRSSSYRMEASITSLRKYLPVNLKKNMDWYEYLAKIITILIFYLLKLKKMQSIAPQAIPQRRYGSGRRGEGPLSGGTNSNEL